MMNRSHIALRLHPKLQGIWPPEPGGAFQRGTDFPLSGQDVLKQVFYYAPVSHAKANVSLKTFYKGAFHSRDLLIDDVEFARRLAERLKHALGKTVSELGEIEIDF